MAAVAPVPVSTSVSSTEPLLDLAHSLATVAPKGFIDTIVQAAQPAVRQVALGANPALWCDTSKLGLAWVDERGDVDKFATLRMKSSRESGHDPVLKDTVLQALIDHMVKHKYAERELAEYLACIQAKRPFSRLPSTTKITEEAIEYDHPLGHLWQDHETTHQLACWADEAFYGDCGEQSGLDALRDEIETLLVDNLAPLRAMPRPWLTLCVQA